MAPRSVEAPSDPALTPSARTVLARRYLRRDARGDPAETPAQLFERVAAAVAAAEAGLPGGDPDAWRPRFAARLRALELLPNSPTLMNAGRPDGQLAACFVLPVEDSLARIFDAVKHAALIHQTGGGTGFAFSRLRAHGDAVGDSAGVASGPVAFMKVIDAATEAIRQGGARRGANMGILRVDHPDVLAFVEAKSRPGVLENFNLSVAVTDAFMAALAAGGTYALVSPRNGDGAEVGRLPAREVWERIAAAAWASGEPGLVFIDRINADNPTGHEAAIESTNPCGELPLPPFDSCNLGSIALPRFLRRGAPADGTLGAARAALDWERLGEAVREAVRFLDDVIEANTFPLPEIAATTRRNRRIGLGPMGWAELLMRAGLPYDSEEAVLLGAEVAAFFQREARAASRALAAERGPFPAYAGSRWEREGVGPLRNATLLTVAPTGTISVIAGTTSGIEPLFALALTRHVLDGAALPETFPFFEEVARREGFSTPALLAEVQRRGTCRGLAVPPRFQRLFAVAREIAPEWHLRHQATWQRFVDNAVSKTVNLPADATPADVARIYALAYEWSCKGITVYRDQSRPGQVLEAGLPTDD
ncbi:MAG TPA: adenosylcobalamin-dependent ribonucleoside-diphosphate reductase [Myxococcota bacterium]|nr:adenosylcobalamin-dependent ribonucleoside-diphosphate reductase [Myxococcota bacterium]